MLFALDWIQWQVAPTLHHKSTILHQSLLHELTTKSGDVLKILSLTKFQSRTTTWSPPVPRSWKLISYYILKQVSAYVQSGKEHLLTFSEKGTRRSQLERDRRLVQKCLYQRMKWLKQTGNPVDRLSEQYNIPLPLAIAKTDGCPHKGWKTTLPKPLKFVSKLHHHL